jgi:hypothetical protein
MLNRQHQESHRRVDLETDLLNCATLYHEWQNSGAGICAAFEAFQWEVAMDAGFTASTVAGSVGLQRDRNFLRELASSL